MATKKGNIFISVNENDKNAKKLFFHSSVWANFVKLNLASLKTQQTEKNRTINQPIFPRFFSSQKYIIN